MSNYSLYEGTIVPVTGAIKSFLAILSKAEAHYASTDKPESFLEARLAPDMLPFTFQAYCVSDLSSKMLDRILGNEPAAAKWDDLKTIADVRASLNATLEKINKVDRATIAEQVDAKVSFGMGPGVTVESKAYEYAGAYSLPNIFFHLTTAYAILRKEGVEIGKRDYLGEFMKPLAGAPA